MYGIDLTSHFHWDLIEIGIEICRHLKDNLLFRLGGQRIFRAGMSWSRLAAPTLGKFRLSPIEWHAGSQP
jgi:hypothetical protein